MGRGLAWLLIAATTGTSSSTGSTEGSGTETTSSTTGSGGDTTGTSSSSGDTTTVGSTTSDSTGQDTSTSACLSAPLDGGEETGPCLTLARESDGCGCGQAKPSSAAMLLAVLLLGWRRRSRGELLGDLAVSGRLPQDVVDRLRR